MHDEGFKVVTTAKMIIDTAQVTTVVADIPISAANTMVTTTPTTEATKTTVKIVPDDGDDVTIKATPLSFKSPTIVDYKIHKEGKKHYFQIFRADANSQMIISSLRGIVGIKKLYEVTTTKAQDQVTIADDQKGKILSVRAASANKFKINKYCLNLKNDMPPRDKKHYKALSINESRSPDFDLISDQEEYSKEEVAKTITEIMEQYMSKTLANYGSGVARPKIEDKDNFEPKGQFLKELHDNTFSGSDHEDANEHIEKVLEIVDLFNIPNITIDQVIIRAFPMSLTGATSHWLRNKPSGAIPSKTAIDVKVAIQEMDEYSQKCHNRTSRTKSTKTSDRLAAIQAQLNNHGREIKKVNENFYVAQSIRTIVEADTSSIHRMGSSQYALSTGQNRTLMKHYKALSIDESRSPDFDLISDQEEYSKEEVAKTITEIMEQYMSKTLANYGSGVARPKIEDKDNFEPKGQFLKELHDNTFSGSDHEDANEHIEKVLEIVDLFNIPNITIDQVIIRAFPMSLTGATSRWLRNKPSEMQEVVLFYNGLDVLTRQILDLRGEIPSKTSIDVKVSIQEMDEYSQKCHNRTSRTKSTKTSDRLAAIQAQLNNHRREIKKVNANFYVAQEGDIEQQLWDSTKGTM
nr:hypothetical protein [Tanacetum cinerariifolium]